jgi:hypothetical protein
MELVTLDHAERSNHLGQELLRAWTVPDLGDQVSDRLDTLSPEIEQELQEGIAKGKRTFSLSNCGHLTCIPQSVVDARLTRLFIDY